MTPWLTSASAFSERAVRRFLRSPEAVVNTVIFPLLLLFAMFAAFATAVEAFEGGDYAQRLVPGLVVAGLMFGSLGTAVGFQQDLQKGFIARIRTMPIRPSTTIVGILSAEVVRAVAALLVVGVVGYGLGFRLDGGWWTTLLILPVAVVIGIALTMPGLALASRTSTTEALSAPLSALFLVLLFLSSSMVPVDAYPDWIQPVVKVSPVTAFVQLLDGMARGGEIAEPALRSAFWAAVLVTGFGIVTLNGIRRAVTAS